MITVDYARVGITMEKEIKRFSPIYPWYAGFTGDLLFYIAVDTLFLTVVKAFSAAQIVSLTSFSQFACIALQFPILFQIKRMGNTASTRTGAFFLLLSAVFITFGGNYYLVLLNHPMRLVMAISFVISVIEILLGIKLYAMVTAGKAEPACE